MTTLSLQCRDQSLILWQDYYKAAFHSIRSNFWVLSRSENGLSNNSKPLPVWCFLNKRFVVRTTFDENEHKANETSLNRTRPSQTFFEIWDGTVVVANGRGWTWTADSYFCSIISRNRFAIVESFHPGWISKSPLTLWVEFHMDHCGWNRLYSQETGTRLLCSGNVDLVDIRCFWPILCPFE